MRIDYGVAIRETAAELAAAERRQRQRAGADRAKLLRLLKSGAAPSLRRGAALLGYSERQAQRWWKRYAMGGLEALLAVTPHLGPAERITPAAWTGLAAEMRAGRIARLKDAQAYLRERHGIAYSLNGVWELLRRRQAKPKTGRKRHVKADPAAQAAFKKGVQHGTGRAARDPGLRHR
jgi:transposase